MEICITFGGMRHCFHIPIPRFPWGPVVGPGPVNYPAFLSDATVVATLHEFAGNVVDNKVKSALQMGVQAAVRAMQEHIGQDVQVQLAPQRQQQ